MSGTKPPAASVEFGPDGPRFLCAKCSYSLEGLGIEGDAVRCSECGLDQRLDRKEFVVFSRLDIIATTAVVWFLGGFVALMVFERGAQRFVHLAFLLSICAAAPSLLITLLLAKRINRPAGLTMPGRIACAIWWWFLGSLISLVVAAALLGPAFAQ
jgi:hypothetical protein